MSSTNPWLLAGGVLSIAASLVHLGAIAGGAEWYRALGAGERMARMAEAGWLRPHLLTFVIAAVLTGFGLYAFSGAGAIRRLPLLLPVLILVTGIYLARGLFLFVPHAAWRSDLTPGFKTWSSAIVLGFGLVHLIGVVRGWPALKGVS